MWIHEKIVIWGNIKMKRKKIWISVIASMLIGTVSVAASSGIELHEFFNEKGEKVIYPWLMAYHILYHQLRRGYGKQLY